ncbi:MAG TPA: nitronate monooxygenase [Pseudonocardia sp.]|jgi:nitronate monooxygenase|uniref:NAD(P)H-dependent flavin oxidoreductase n=1 Tax=Pseudonocardia sp. TaxID=60912 RepID=UPI002B4ADDDF|nr:nitronate monooxygenase [Pseudonocardia sp.]HLU56034.1 nitronate monooxygenase [Pseudonocardia sp.]
MPPPPTQAGTLSTRFTTRFGVPHPILLAPMGTVAGGALASAVTAGGGLGQIGVGYGDRAWLEREFARAGHARVGCGFITWKLAAEPGLLDAALEHRPAAVTLSFGKPSEFAPRVHDAGIPLICQVGTAEEARQALDVGADVVVAQGGEGGGHGVRRRSTLTLLPEVVDLVAASGRDVPVLAAGGISDGRGLAAALVLGADGVMVGTRFWACREALIAGEAQARAVGASGDDTLPTTVYDRVRGYTWPPGYTSRVLATPFVRRWHGRDGELAAALPELREQYRRAAAANDYDVAQILVGEGIGVVDAVRPAAEVVEGLVRDAVAALHAAAPQGPTGSRCRGAVSASEVVP